MGTKTDQLIEEMIGNYKFDHNLSEIEYRQNLERVAKQSAEEALARQETQPVSQLANEMGGEYDPTVSSKEVNIMWEIIHILDLVLRRIGGTIFTLIGLMDMVLLILGQPLPAVQIQIAICVVFVGRLAVESTEQEIREANQASPERR